MLQNTSEGARERSKAQFVDENCRRHTVRNLKKPQKHTTHYCHALLCNCATPHDSRTRHANNGTRHFATRTRRKTQSTIPLRNAVRGAWPTSLHDGIARKTPQPSRVNLFKHRITLESNRIDQPQPWPQPELNKIDRPQCSLTLEPDRIDQPQL